MTPAEPRWHQVTAALAGRLDGGQIADLLWMAQQLAAEIDLTPGAKPDPAAVAKPDQPATAATPAATPSAPVPPVAKARDQASPASSTSAAPRPEALLEPATGAGAPPAGTPTVSLPEAGLLQRQRRRIGRALAPLNRQVESGPARRLDVRATVEAIARARVDRSSWLPVLRPRREPWLALHLVFDDHPSMALWQQLRRELPRTLAQQLRWRDLRCWRLGRGTAGQLELRGAHGRRCSPGQLCRPGGRDLVVVVSDAVAPCWRDGAMARQLEAWASQGPVALLQVLPPRLWPRTGLGQQEPGWVVARRPLQPNRTLSWQPADIDPFAEPEADAPSAPTGFTLPLASLEPESLAALARLLSGTAPASLRGFRFSPPPANAATAPPALPTPEPDSQAIEQQLALFLFSASPQARRLLGLLTIAPVITLPVVRLIQRQQLAGGGPAQIAEVLFSGLFRNVAAAPAPGAPRVPADRQRLVFVDEALRGRLREGLRVGEARAVFDAVKAEVARSLNCSVDSFEALLKQPPPPGSISDSEALQAFATVAPSCLRGLGRRYEELADAIEKGWAPEDVDVSDVASRLAVQLTEGAAPLQRGQVLVQLAALASADVVQAKAVVKEAAVALAQLLANPDASEEERCDGALVLALVAVEQPLVNCLASSSVPIGVRRCAAESLGLLAMRSVDPEQRRRIEAQLEAVLRGERLDLRVVDEAGWKEHDEQLPLLQGASRGLQLAASAELPLLGSGAGRVVPMLTLNAFEAGGGLNITTEVVDLSLWKLPLPAGEQLEIVAIPGGDHSIGSPLEEEGRDWYARQRERCVDPASGQPLNVEAQRSVRLAAFGMVRHLITQAQWQAVAELPPVECEINPTPGSFRPEAEALWERFAQPGVLPVDGVSWNDCQEWLRRLNRWLQQEWAGLAGAGDPPQLALPGEGQWEAACRAGAATPFHFGDVLDASWANFHGGYTYGPGRKGAYRQRPLPIGALGLVNRWGLAEMHGQLLEWCGDQWHREAKGEGWPSDGHPWEGLDGGLAGSAQQGSKLLRGGSWFTVPLSCRAASRDISNPGQGQVQAGFRPFISTISEPPIGVEVLSSLVLLADGRLASGSGDGTIRLWDGEGATCLQTLNGHQRRVRSLAVLPDGRLASCSFDGTIRLWDPASGACASVIQAPGGLVLALAVLPDGRLASSSSDAIIRLWDPASGVCTAERRGHDRPARALAVLPDGRLASGADDATIRLWDPASNACLAVLEGHRGAVYALAVLADGRLASGATDRTIRLWDPATAACTAVLEGHTGSVAALAALADGRLASGSFDQTMRLWDPATGACLASTDQLGAPVRALVALADGRLAAGTADHSIRLWAPDAKPFPDLEPFTLGYETAWLEEIELQEIRFTTSTLTERGKRQDREGQAWAFLEPEGPKGLTLVQIPAGTFLMGSPDDEPQRSDDEGPQHAVTLESFLMGQTPITQAQWREVAQWRPREGERWERKLKPTPSRFRDKADSDKRPVEQVSWFDAMEFCSRLSQRTGRFYTLPSEAQWEYACRAGTTTPFHFGPTITPELANYNGNHTYADGPKGVYREETTPVASFPANGWGLRDMHGNVYDWCLDHWHGSHEGAPVDGSAWLDPVESSEEDTNKGRLLRGGSWLLDPGGCRSAYRLRNVPGGALNNVGFRVVCLPQGPSLNP